MDKQSEKKRAKLKGLKRNLKSDQQVQNHQLKRWLSDGEFKEMEDDWKFQQSLRDDLSSPPEEITEYKKRLHKVNLLYSRAEDYSHRKLTAAEDMYHQSEVLAEELIEFLHEFLQTDQSLEMWFDRFPDENNHGLTPKSLPQVITSRSRYNQGGGFSRFKKSKQEVKIDAVERAITALDEPRVMDDEVSARGARMSSILKMQ